VIALVQRVSRARVDVAGHNVAAIEQGLLVLLCAEPSDTDAIADKMVARLLKLRVFDDEAGRMNRSVVDVGGALLVVSQFTLAADTSAGNRPSFTGAAPAALGRLLYERVVATARERHRRVQCGVYGANMQVELVNDGPVTIPLTVRQ
jgi:D-tyrosyl-tRNA(Tyr) deacylase